MALAPPVRAHRQPLDVSRAQRTAVVDQAALGHRRVPDQLAVLPQQRVHSAQAVLPVRVGELVTERLVEQVPHRGERLQAQVTRVRHVHEYHVTALDPVGLIN